MNPAAAQAKPEGEMRWGLYVQATEIRVGDEGYRSAKLFLLVRVQ